MNKGKTDDIIKERKLANKAPKRGVAVRNVQLRKMLLYRGRKRKKHDAVAVRTKRDGGI